MALLPLFALPSVGQEKLTMEQCLELAKANNASLKAADLALEAADLTRKSTHSLYFPSFTLTGGLIYTSADGSYASGTGMLPVFDATGAPIGQQAYFPGIDLNLEGGLIYNTAIKVEQPIYQGGKITAAYRITRQAYEINAQNRRLTETEVILSTARAYADVVKASQLQAVAKSHYALLTSLMDNVEKARARGVKPKSDVLKVQVKLNESELALRKTSNALKLATMNLCHYIGRPLTDNVTVTEDLPAAGDCDKEASGIENRPEYAILEGKTKVAAQQIRMARSELLPKIGVMGQYGYMNGLKLNDQKLMHSWNGLVGLSVSIPLFDSMHSAHKLKAAKVQYAQVQAERDDTNDMLFLEMTRAMNNLDESSLECSLAESSVKSAEENLRASKAGYDKGSEILTDYLEAQTLWLKAHQTLIESETDRYICWLDYLRTCGRLN